MRISAAARAELAGGHLDPLAVLRARHGADGALAALLDMPARRVPRRQLERVLLRPATDLLARPGKRLRERLVALGWSLAGAPGLPPPSLGVAVELLHAGSLVVDDIEDGSTRRRGGPTLHRRYGLPLALNVGNWLYFLPFELLAEAATSPAMELQLRRSVGRAVLRCHYGQALDLGVKVGTLPQRDVPDLVATISELKTGSLTELAATLGAIAAGASPRRERALARFARRLGVGLQMLDDLANLSSRRERAKCHEDIRLGRATWPWAWAASRLAPTRYAALQRQARLIERGDGSASRLATTLSETLGDVGRSSAEAWLARATTGVRNAVPGVDGAQLDAEIERVRARLG